MKINCEWCRQTVIVKPTTSTLPQRIFCSNGCMTAFLNFRDGLKREVKQK